MKYQKYALFVLVLINLCLTGYLLFNQSNPTEVAPKHLKNRLSQGDRLISESFNELQKLKHENKQLASEIAQLKEDLKIQSMHINELRQRVERK